MAEQFSMPSMFDTRYAMDRQMQTDAHAAGIAGGGGKRYGMYYNSSLLGDRDNASLMSLTGMMGGQGDPRIQKQNAIDTIMKQYPNPETAEDFRAIANALQQQGLYDESNRAMSMANEIRSSTPARTKTKAADGYYYWDDTGTRVFEGITKTAAKSNAWKEYTDMTSNPTPEGFQIWYEKYKVTGDSKPNSYQEYALTTDTPTSEGYAEHLSNKGDKDALTGVEASLELFRTTKIYKEAKNPSEQIKLENEHIREFNSLNDPAKYSEEIADIMTLINPETSLLYTNDEAQIKHAENKRKTGEQELDVIAQTADFNFAHTTVHESAEASNLSYKDIESFNNILQAYDQGAKTGRLENTLLGVKGLLRTLGYTGDINNIMSQEILLAEFEKLALSRMQFLSGSASDNDIKFVKGGGPSFDKTPEANMLLIQQAMQISVEAQNKAAFIRAYVANWQNNNKTLSPSSWELTGAIEAFKNRGDYSDSAQAKYGDIWKNQNFINAQGTREQLIDRYGLNQLNSWEKYNKLKAGDLSLGNLTEHYTSNIEQARAILAEDE